MSIFNIGTSSLLATQAALAVSSNNISNASNDGYTRQRLVLESTSSVRVGGALLGQGVNMVEVSRVGAEHLEIALRNTSSQKYFYSTIASLGVELDKIISDQNTGLDKSIQSMFTTIGDLANSPASEATRAVVLDSLGSLASKINSYGDILQSSRDGVDRDIASYVDRINTLSQDLVAINESLATAKAQTGQFPSELLDKQNNALGELARYVDISVHKEESGAASVYLAGGVGLVTSNIFSPLQISDNGYESSGDDVYLRGINITSELRGGELGGLIAYRDEVLETAEKSVGQIALTLGQMLNLEHKQGFTPSGVAGAELVNNFSAFGYANDANLGSGSLTVSFDFSQPYATQVSDVSAIKARSYEVVVTAGGYELYDHSTGDLLASGAGTSFKVDGLQFDLGGAVAAQDRFFIAPGQSAMEQFSVQITDPADIANGHDPLGSTSDNRNTLALYDLKNAKYVNGVDSFQSAYSTLTASIGSKVSTAETNMNTASLTNNQAQFNRESLSGVNVEEEAANLLRLQQQYSAAAKIISAAQTIFEDLISVLR